MPLEGVKRRPEAVVEEEEGEGCFDRWRKINEQTTTKPQNKTNKQTNKLRGDLGGACTCSFVRPVPVFHLLVFSGAVFHETPSGSVGETRTDTTFF